ncbi:MFS transporter [Streptomyces sp. DSM 44915]|uniref:MFS transporter n=1 Tax=Streptomyces chisholmiae TaxID=3075540 RepID=A0ABU2JV85_9ACTN|nr:MFS transporter [Streptomyces sp. DSM 44915]MDT0268659.1 MFS transporter [Streptomyces sp. DSM 44915]
MTTRVTPPAPPASASVWRNREFLRFFAAQTTSFVGDMMLPVALTVAMLSAGFGASEVGLVLAAQIAPLVVLMLVGGVLADRFQARRMMILADLVRLVGIGVMAFDVAQGRPSLWLLIVIQAVTGAATALHQPGVAGMVPAVAPHQVREANAALRIGISIGATVGPMSAGIIVGFATPATAIALDAVTFAISAACLAAIRPLAAPGRAARESLWQGIREGWHEFRSRDWLWPVIGVFALLGLTLYGPFQVLSATVLTERDGAGGYGLMMSLFGAGAAAGGLVAMRIRPRFPLRGGIVALLGYVPVPLLVAAGAPLVVLGPAFAAAGAGASVWAVMWATTVQTRIPADVINRIYAYDQTGSMVLQPVGRALAGPAAGLLGTGAVFTLSAVCLLVGCLALLAIPAFRGLRGDQPA